MLSWKIAYGQVPVANTDRYQQNTQETVHYSKADFNVYESQFSLEFSKLGLMPETKNLTLSNVVLKACS